ncbi:MAG TPA: Na+/H+ antiporter NhaA, partial [Clostridia bacterium]|nr:Na+/H+ antiporter NhaA [Clostridia bacterium]
MSIPARSRGELNVAMHASPAARRVELPVASFIHMQGAGGMLLLGASVIALVWANSRFGPSYFALWHATISFDLGPLHLAKSLHHWINDGLMAVFFFLVGMEIKHEFVSGQLASFRRAALPIVAALGGMLAPAALYFMLNAGRPGQSGWGVPMATDIAFALAVLAVIPRVPIALKVFLLALAIVDDLGAIIVIAIFYTDAISFAPLGVGVLLLGVAATMRVIRVRHAFPYVLVGISVWICVLQSGIHATVAGVVLAFAVSGRSLVPRESFHSLASSMLGEFSTAIRNGDDDAADVALGSLAVLTEQTESPLERITRQLHGWVSFLILPLFALANAGVVLSADAFSRILRDPISLGVAAGLLLGKPLGIVALSWLAVRFGMAELPASIRWRHMWGTGLLAGIGFTVAIFIADLAFETPEQLQVAKLAILCTSALAGVGGYVLLRGGFREQAATAEEKAETTKQEVPAGG